MTPLAKKRHWLSTFGCCLTGRIDCDLVHLHEGEGTSSNQKVPDALTLPMSTILHRAQHKHADFWQRALPGEDPKDWAVRLDDIWKDRDLESAAALLGDMQARADRAYLAPFLIRAAR